MQSLSQMTLLDPAMPSRSSCRRCAHYSTTDLSTDGHVLVSQAGDALFLLSRLDLADMDRLWGVWLGILFTSYTVGLSRVRQTLESQAVEALSPLFHSRIPQGKQDMESNAE